MTQRNYCLRPADAAIVVADHSQSVAIRSPTERDLDQLPKLPNLNPLELAGRELQEETVGHVLEVLRPC